MLVVRSICKSAFLCGLAGIGIAVLVLVTRLSNEVVLVLWPTSFWLMATEGAGRSTTIEVVSVSILANFGLYFVLGLIFTAAYRKYKQVAPDSQSH